MFVRYNCRLCETVILERQRGRVQARSLGNRIPIGSVIRIRLESESESDLNLNPNPVPVDARMSELR
jgi:hypothetical protein